MSRGRVEPGPGQESVWDYPRPPRVEPCSKLVRIVFAETVIVETREAWRLLETSHPPVFYVPPSAVREGCLEASPRGSFCEWKGSAVYYSVVVGERRAEDAVWSYPSPTATFQAIANYLAFYPSAMDLCSVDGEAVQAQEGDFYGGWITKDIVGPFKGGAGTWGW